MGNHGKIRTALLGLGLLVLANSAELGKEYNYSYEGTMQYEASVMNIYKPGMAFRSVVRWQKLDDLHVAMKFEDLKLAIIDDPKFNWTNVEKLTYEKNDHLSEMVEKPFVVTYAYRSDGAGYKFQHLETHALDPMWSVNLKKALASLQNVYLQPQGIHTYDSVESTIHGDCRVYWNQQSLPHWTNPDAKVLNVSRVIDPEKCSRAASKLYGSIKANPCVNCESVNTHPLSSGSNAYYQFFSTEKNTNLVLEKASSRSTVSHAPYTEYGNVVKLTTKQNLKLLETKHITEKFEVQGDTQVYQTLNMDFSTEKGFKRAIDMKKANSYVKDWELKGCSKKAIEKFKELAALSNDEEDQLGMFDRKDPARSFSEAIKAVSLLDYQGMEEVFDKIVKKAPEDKRTQMHRTFVEVTSAAGHNAGIQFIIDKITSNELDTRFILSFLKGIYMGILEYSQTTLDTILDFCKSDLMNTFPRERMQCMLTYTALVDESCRMATYAPEYADPECQGQKLQNEVFDKLVPEYEVARENREALKNYIHIARNLKTQKSVEFLKQVIDDESLEHFTHTDAMNGMIGIVPAHISLIRKMAADIYLNSTKPADIRILASIAIFKSSPPLSLLEAIVDGLKNEPSDQVRSYVLSMIKEIDETNHPCFKATAQHIRYVITKVIDMFPSEFKRKDFLTSHMQLSASYDPKYDYGGHIIRSVIMSDSYLPSQVHIGFGNYMANFLFNKFGLLVRQQGMEKLTDYWHSPRTLGASLGRSLWNFFGRRRLARDAAGASSYEQELDEKLKLKHRKYKPMRFEMQLSAFGHDLNLISLNESHFAPLISADHAPSSLLKQLLSADMDVHRFVNFHHVTFEIPTEVGLPALVHVEMPAVISYKNKNSSFDLTKEGVVKLKLNHRLVIDTRLKEHYAFKIPGMQVAIGIGFNKRIGLNLPINFAADVNLATSKVQFNRDFQLPRDVVDYHFQPYVFQHHCNNPDNDKYEPLFKTEELKEMKANMLGDFLGVNFEIKGHHLPDDAIYEDLPDWLYKYDCKQKFYYWITNPQWHPRKFHLSVQPAETDPTTGLILTIKHKITPPEALERPSSSFQEFQADLPASFVHVLHVSNEFRGNKKRKSELEIRYSYTPDRTSHWFQMFYDRTPFSSNEKDNLKICMLGKVKQTITDWQKLTHDEVQRINNGQNIEVEINLHYGKDCKSGPEVAVHAVYDHSNQQKEWLEELETGIEKTRTGYLSNPYMTNYRRCTKGLAKGLVMPIACHKFIIHSSQLNRMVMEIKFNKQVRLDENPYLSTVYVIARSAYYPYLRKYYLRPNNTIPGQIHIKSVVRTPDFNKRVTDIEFKGPRHTSVWKSVPISHGAHWAPKTATHLGMTNLQSYSRKWYHRFCDIQKNSVATFDSVIYEMPESKCWKVLTKDCSENHLFTLLIKDTVDNRKVVKLIMDMHIFEVNYVGEKIMLKMDDAEEELVVGLPKIVKNEHNIPTHIFKTINGHFMIDVPVDGIYVLGIRSAVFVQVAPYYRGKLCGLCSDFNLDRQHEFHTTDGCHHNTPWSFAYNFVVPDDTCSVPEATGADRSHCENDQDHVA